MSRFVPLLIAASVLFLIDIYAFQAIRHALASSSTTLRRSLTILYWGISAFAIGSVFSLLITNPFVLPQPLRVIWFGALIVFYLPKVLLLPFLLIDDGVRAIRWGVFAVQGAGSKNAGNAITRSDFIVQTGLVISGLFFGGLVYGVLRGGYNYQVRRVALKLPHLPDAFNGLRIVQISDIHSGSFTVEAPLKRAVELINEQKADLVFFTGDLVNNGSAEIFPFISIFNKIKAKLGVYSIFGNHDYADYSDLNPQQKAKDIEHLAQAHKQLGWKLLRNENVLIGEGGDQIAIIGMENWGTHFQKYGDMAKSYAGAENAKVKLLLSHDPTHWDAEVSKKYTDVDVTFSGHTHGAQMGIEIPGYVRWSPAKYIYDHWAGLYQQDKQYLYVNRGFGFLAYPGRLGISPEITVFELNKG